MGIRAAAVFWVSFSVACSLVPALPAPPAFILREGSGAILGNVYDLDSGTAVAGATVIIGNQENESERTFITAADGTFFASALSPGLYLLRARAEGFQEGFISGYPVRLTDSVEPARIGLSGIGSSRRSGTVSSPPSQSAAQSTNTSESALPLEVQVRWDLNGHASALSAAEPAMAGNVGRFSLLESRQLKGPIPRQRAPELTSDQILVVIADERGVQRGWTIIPDPRIIRAEGPGPDGELSGQTFYRPITEFLVPVSEGLVHCSLRFYQPHWTGKDYSLNLLGTLTVR